LTSAASERGRGGILVAIRRLGPRASRSRGSKPPSTLVSVEDWGERRNAVTITPPGMSMAVKAGMTVPSARTTPALKRIKLRMAGQTIKLVGLVCPVRFFAATPP